MPGRKATQVAIIGAGNIGISTAYYLAIKVGITDILLIDAGSPMAFTSAQSGENYRNWWPHSSMVEFTNHSIDLMEEIARNNGNRINMNRRGGDISGQQLGMLMLEALRDAGSKRMIGRVKEIAYKDHFTLGIETAEGRHC